jgi:hypothetical protein
VVLAQVCPINGVFKSKRACRIAGRVFDHGNASAAVFARCLTERYAIGKLIGIGEENKIRCLKYSYTTCNHATRAHGLWSCDSRFFEPES